jgi:hypothetical protein
MAYRAASSGRSTCCNHPGVRLSNKLFSRVDGQTMHSNLTLRNAPASLAVLSMCFLPKAVPGLVGVALPTCTADSDALNAAKRLRQL